MTKWLDRALFTSPIDLCLCTTEKLFNEALSKLGVNELIDWLPAGADAVAHTINNDSGTIANIVCIDPWLELSKIEIHCILMHEAVHVWQDVREAIGERNPSYEFEAYCIQSVARKLITEYEEQVKPKVKTKKKKAK